MEEKDDVASTTMREGEHVHLSNNGIDGVNHVHIRRKAGGSSVPGDTHVHLSRSGSVDIFAASPPRRGSGTGGQGMFEASFETTTPDNRRVRMTSDGTPLRDSTNSFMPADYISTAMGGGVSNRTSGAGKARFAAEAGSSSSSVTSSSKAVLSALRALQDKIKRLENERMTAMDDANRLRRHVEELEQSSETQITLVQDKHNSARLAYERLLAEKTAVDAKLANSEDKRRELASQLNNLRGRLTVEENARREAERVVAAVEERVRQTEGAVKGLQGHKTEAFKTLELELERERRKREELEQSKEKVGEVLLSVLDMNEHLVNQYSSSSEPKRKKKVKKTTKSRTTTAAAASGTLRAQARDILAGRGGTMASSASRGTLLRSTAASKARKTATATANSIRAVSASSMLQLPFLPAPHRKTFNLLAALSEAVRQCRTREPKQILDALYDLIIHDSDYVTHKTERTAFPTPPRPVSARCSRMKGPSQSEQILGESRSMPSPCSHTWSPPRGRTFRPSPEKASRGEEELATLIYLVQEDLEELNRRHQDLLQRARHAGEGGGNEEGMESLQADEIKVLFQTIQRKEHELQLLKLSRRKMRHKGGGGRTMTGTSSAASSPLMSPQVARMSFLHGIRDAASLDLEGLTSTT